VVLSEQRLALDGTEAYYDARAILVTLVASQHAACKQCPRFLFASVACIHEKRSCRTRAKRSYVATTRLTRSVEPCPMILL
jgi:hypothetical protein